MRVFVAAVLAVFLTTTTTTTSSAAGGSSPTVQAIAAAAEPNHGGGGRTNNNNRSSEFPASVRARGGSHGRPGYCLLCNKHNYVPGVSKTSSNSSKTIFLRNNHEALKKHLMMRQPVNSTIVMYSYHTYKYQTVMVTYDDGSVEVLFVEPVEVLEHHCDGGDGSSSSTGKATPLSSSLQEQLQQKKIASLDVVDVDLLVERIFTRMQTLEFPNDVRIFLVVSIYLSSFGLFFVVCLLLILKFMF